MYEPCRNSFFNKNVLPKNYIILRIFQKHHQSPLITPLPTESRSSLLLCRSHADYHAYVFVLSSINGGWLMYYYTISNVDTWSK